MRVKSGARALGVAASDGVDRSTLCGAVVRADRVVDGLAFASCGVGDLDATDAAQSLLEFLDREDVRFVLVAGVAPAWFNVLDLRALEATADRPVVSVSFEASDGLADDVREHFEGDARDRRLSIYESLPPRRPVEVNGEDVFVRSVGIDGDDAADVVRAYTPEGGRPEPLRVARLAARAGREYRGGDGDGEDESESESET